MTDRTFIKATGHKLVSPCFIGLKSLLANLNHCIFSVDTDECANRNGGCSHHCFNIPGAFYCGCPEEIAMSSNNLTCSGKCIRVEPDE